MQKLCKLHKTEPIKYYCIDEYCIEPQRVMCGTCQSQKLHKTHHITSIEEVENLLQDNHNSIVILEKEGLKQIEDTCSKKLKKYLEIIEQTLVQWQRNKIQNASSQVNKKKLQSKIIINKMRSIKDKFNAVQDKQLSDYEDIEEAKENQEYLDDENQESDEDDDTDQDCYDNDNEDDEDINEGNEIKEIGKQYFNSKKVEEYLTLSSEENQFIMQALRDKKQKISQKQQIEGMINQKFSDIEIQIQKLQRFINNKFSFSLKDFQGVVKNQWNSEYTSDCPSILQFNEEQTLVYAAENSIQLQNINEEVSEEISDAHELSIVALEKMNENMIVSGSYDGMIKSWCPRTGSRLSFRNSYHISGVSCLKKLDKVHLISGDEIGNVVISNIKNNKIIRIMKNKFTSDMSLLTCIEVAKPSKTIITGSQKGQVDFWDYSRGEIVRQIKIYSGIRGFFLPTSFLLMIGQNDGSITCWDCREGTKVRTYEQDFNLTTIKRLGPDTFMASYQNQKVKFFNFMSQKPFRQIEHDEDIIGILPLYKNNQIVTLDGCNELTLWE